MIICQNECDKDEEEETNDTSIKESAEEKEAPSVSEESKEEKVKVEETQVDPVLEIADPVKLQKKIDRLCKVSSSCDTQTFNFH